MRCFFNRPAPLEAALSKEPSLTSTKHSTPITIPPTKTSQWVICLLCFGKQHIMIMYSNKLNTYDDMNINEHTNNHAHIVLVPLHYYLIFLQQYLSFWNNDILRHASFLAHLDATGIFTTNEDVSACDLKMGVATITFSDVKWWWWCWQCFFCSARTPFSSNIYMLTPKKQST